MACNNPWFKPIKEKYKVFRGDWRTPNARYDSIPCGRCMGCRIDKRNQLQDRIEYEYIKKYKFTGSFITLTYANTFEPKSDICGAPTLRKSDIQKLLKRIRKEITDRKLPIKLKYIIAGEYGEENGRPHYHGIILGLNPNVLTRILRKKWDKGFIQCNEIKRGGIRYILKYIESAKMGEERRNILKSNGIETPFATWSKGLGNGLFKENQELIKKTGCYEWHNRRRPAIQYFKQLILADAHATARQYKEAEKMAREQGFANAWQWDRVSRKAREQNMSTRARNSGQGVPEIITGGIN